MSGDSPNPDAPPFRTLSSKYPVSDLAESLAEGIVSGHPEMPIFVFMPNDVDAIIAYLESIQTTAPPAPGENAERLAGRSLIRRRRLPATSASCALSSI